MLNKKLTVFFFFFLNNVIIAIGISSQSSHATVEIELGEAFQFTKLMLSQIQWAHLHAVPGSAKRGCRRPHCEIRRVHRALADCNLPAVLCVYFDAKPRLKKDAQGSECFEDRQSMGDVNST